MTADEKIMHLEGKVFELKREILRLQEGIIAKDKMILSIVENGVSDWDLNTVLGIPIPVKKE